MLKQALNILVVTAYYAPALVYGGPVTVTHNLNKALSDLGHKITVYTTDANGTGNLDVPLGQPILLDSLPVWYFQRLWFISNPKPFTIFFSPALGQQLNRIKSGDYDLIVNCSIWTDPGRMTAAMARRSKTPYVCYTFGCFEPWALMHQYWKKKIYFSLIERGILQRASGIIVSNDEEAKQIRKLGIKTRIEKIPCEAITSSINQNNLPTRIILEALIPELTDRPFLLFLSRLHPKKGLDMLIPAFATVAKELPDWILVIAGTDEQGYLAQLKRMVEEVNLKARIHFITGFVSGERKAALLSHAAFLVLPSYSEGFPAIVPEALKHGCPALITTTCYIPEVAEGGAGLVVPPEQRALTIAMRTMMQNSVFRNNCSQNALKVAQRHFTREAVAKQTLDFYREVINSRKKNQ